MYSILKACRIVRSMDDSKARNEIFESVLRNSLIIRLANNAYAFSPLFVRELLLMLYGAKCFLSLRRVGRRPTRLIYYGAYPSEKRTLGRIQEKLAHITSDYIRISSWNCLRPSAIAAGSQYLLLAFRLRRFARRLAARHSFMPACRIFSVVPFYARSKRLLCPKPDAVFIASQYAPDSLALACAMHSLAGKVFFANHANATGKRRYVPPVEADLVIVTSQALADQYQSHSSKPLSFAFWPASLGWAAIKPLDPLPGQIRVGIFLTALTNEARLMDLLKMCQECAVIGDVFVREHPVKLVRPNTTKTLANGFNSRISKNNPLDLDITRTDLAICGNSTVATELLGAGRPVLYDNRLDALSFDLNGYVEYGLLMQFPGRLSKKEITETNYFYTSEQWVQTMKYFDCGYLDDTKKIADEVVEKIERALDR